MVLCGQHECAPGDRERPGSSRRWLWVLLISTSISGSMSDVPKEGEPPVRGCFLQPGERPESTGRFTS